MRDLFHKISHEMLLLPSVVATTFDSEPVTLDDCNAVCLAVALADQAADIVIEESDDDITYTAVVNDLEIIGATPDASTGVIAAVTADITAVSYVGQKKFVKMTGTVAAETEVCVYAVKGELDLA